MGTIRVVKYVQLGERKQRCWLCLLSDVVSNERAAYAVAIRLNDFIGHWPHSHLVTSEPWGEENLRQLLAWRPAPEAEAEFAERVAAFPTSAGAVVAR